MPAKCETNRPGIALPHCSRVPSLRNVRAPSKANGENDDERIPAGNGFVGQALDRFPVQLHRDARSRLSLPERPVRHDRPGGRRPAAAAGLQHGERQSRGGAGVLLDQGAGRPADLAPAEDQGRRHHPGRPQGDGHADHRQSDSGQAAAAALDRHGARAVREPDQGPRCLRELRDHRARAWLPAGLRARLWRAAGRRPAQGRIVRPADRATS